MFEDRRKFNRRKFSSLTLKHGLPCDALLFAVSVGAETVRQVWVRLCARIRPAVRMKWELQTGDQYSG